MGFIIKKPTEWWALRFIKLGVIKKNTDMKLTKITPEIIY